VTCAAALATLDVFDREDVYARVRRLGEATIARLRAEIGGLPPVRDIRGVGLMIGIELADAATAKAVCARCLDEGVIVLSCGPGENVLRLAPPLTISDADLDAGLTTLIAAITTT